MELECLALGVGHHDEGICLLMRMGTHHILLDCGIDDISPLLKETEEKSPLDFVLVSHAHPDHAKGLLSLHQKFPLLPIYASEVTARLLPLNWVEWESQSLSPFCQILPENTPIELKQGLTVQLYPAGHLPGASAFLLTYKSPQRTYTVLWTGDFFLSNSRLVEGLPLGELRGIKPDVLIIEGSYGTARYPHRRQLENQFAERIYQALAQQKSVLLPTPALGLGQELLMLLRSHHYFTGKDLDIWVDGTVARGCDIYIELLSNFPTSVQNFALHQPLFWDERVRPRVRRLSPTEAPLQTVPIARSRLTENPCIVITDETTPWEHYFTPEETQKWLVLLPQKPGGKRESELLSQEWVETYLLAEHCDGPGTNQFIHNIRPQHIIFVHGSPTYLADLTNLDELRNRYQLHTPRSGTLVELPIGDTFVQPIIPETQYQGEIAEFGMEVAISLPNAITAEPRWANFADTGLVEARWQGEELVLRDLSQREILTQGSDRPFPSDLECCGNCQHYRGQRCWNQLSALFGFKVTPDGFCPVFQSIRASEFNWEGESESEDT